MARICPKLPAEYLKKYKGAANTAQADSSSGHLVKKKQKQKQRYKQVVYPKSFEQIFIFFKFIFIFQV